MWIMDTQTVSITKDKLKSTNRSISFFAKPFIVLFYFPHNLQFPSIPFYRYQMTELHSTLLKFSGF